jgi:putative peptidoglycan lipid II flippase
MILAGTILASFHASGSISAMYFAERLCELPLGMIGVTVGIAALPKLASFAAQENREAFNNTLARDIKLTALLSFPAAAGLAGLSIPITQLIFGHGAYSPQETLLTAACLAAYAPGLPGMCATRPLLAALAALGENRLATTAACKSLVLVVAVALLAHPLGSPGIALGISAGTWLNVFLLLRGLKRKGYPNPFTSGRKFYLLNSIFSGVFCAALFFWAS